MHPLLPVRMSCALAAVPVAVMAAFFWSGALSRGPALAGLGVILIGAAGIAHLWARDVGRIIAGLRHEMPKDRSSLPPKPPCLRTSLAITREAERLAHALAAREAALEAMLRAEQALVRRLPDPLIVVGANRAVQRANASAETIFGPAMNAVLRHPGLRSAIDRAQADGQEHMADLALPVPVSREVSATVIPLQTPLAEGGRIVAVFSDRTRERAVERMRADFVANASHELRTPLASLIGFIDTLRGPAADDPPAQVRFLGIMAEQAKRMNRLIDDLLSLSRIELTEHQPPGERVDVDALLRRVAAGFEPQLAARQVRLALDVAPALPDVAGDEDQLEQVLQNLFDNALKYGREAGSIRVSAWPAPPGKPWPARPGLALSVADDGHGIARAHIPRLTERFYRADKGRSRAVGGTGLGLAIVKHIVNRHRGQLAIDSTEGEGSTFTVWLPAAPPGPDPGLDPAPG